MKEITCSQRSRYFTLLNSFIRESSSSRTYERLIFPDKKSKSHINQVTANPTKTLSPIKERRKYGKRLRFIIERNPYEYNSSSSEKRAQVEVIHSFNDFSLQIQAVFVDYSVGKSPTLQ